MQFGRSLLSILAVLAAPTTAPAQTDAPVILLADGAATSPEAAGEILQALADRRAGRAEAAIARLRGVLRTDPGNIVARRLLAVTLAETGQFEAAEYHYARLVAEDSDPRAQAIYSRSLARIAALKPYGFRAGLALVPSTNINRGTFNDIFSTDFGDFIISEESSGTSGVGLALSAAAFRRIDLGPGQRLQFDARASAVLSDRPEFNQHQFAFGVTWSAAREGKSLSVTPEYGRAYLDGALDHERYTLSVARAVPLDADTGLRLSGSAEHRDYPTDTFLTGERYEIGAELSRRLDPRTALSGSVAYRIGDVQSDSYSYDGYEVGARLRRAFENGLRLDLGVAQEWRPYRGDFTGVTFPREDSVTTLSATAFSERFTLEGAAPTLSCRLAWAQSNIAFYDYDVAECTIGFTRQF